jgi:hypothetical protein
MMLRGTDEHCQASLRHHGRTRTSGSDDGRHRIAQGRTGPDLQEREVIGRERVSDLYRAQAVYVVSRGLRK